MITLLKQQIQVNGKNVIVESYVDETNNICYDVTSTETVNQHDYQVAVESVSASVNKVYRQKILMG